MFRRRVKPRTMVLSSLLAGGSFAAFAVVGWGVEISAVTKALVLIAIVFLAISLPAALLLVILKSIGYLFEKYREK